MIRPSSKRHMILVESLDDVPDFGSEAEEAEYWDTHELGGEGLKRMRPLNEILPRGDVNGSAPSDAR